jgi:hypothetical protein
MRADKKIFGCERLTDALTKLLMPGTSMRDASACNISNRMLLLMESL